MSTNKEDDEELKYDIWYVYDAETALAEARNEIPPAELNDIWSHWSEGVPNKLRKTGWAPAFRLGKVSHNGRLITDTLELDWKRPYAVSF